MNHDDGGMKPDDGAMGLVWLLAGSVLTWQQQRSQLYALPKAGEVQNERGSQ